MAKVIHTINGHRYWYEHYRVGNRVVCKYLGPVDGSKRYGSSGATQLVNAPPVSSFHNKNGECITPQPRYESQEELDNHIRQSYVRGGLGIKRIQIMFAEIDMYPSRREVENYLRDDLDIELRTRTRKTAPTPDTSADELAQSKDIIALNEIEIASKDAQIISMHDASMEDSKKLTRLLSKLRDYRDTGRAPTDAEVEELIE